MKDCLVTGLRSIELGVTDMERSARFYSDPWGLFADGSFDDRLNLRAGDGHIAVTLAKVDAPRLMSVTLTVKDVAALDELQGRAAAAGVAVSAGGRELVLQGPEDLQLKISADSEEARALPADRSKPITLTHVVLNSADVAAHLRLFIDVLGFRLSDSTDRMEFIRCGTDHHTVALAHSKGLSLNHAAFEMRDIDSLMYGVGRLIDHGCEVQWGLGRHGPGNNVFSYFIDPDGFVVEYTTEMEQVRESYPAHDARYWSDFPRRPCRWGVARKPSDALMRAMDGMSQQASPGWKVSRTVVSGV